MMRRLERILTVAGVLGVAWFATAHIAAVREQAALSRELEQARAATSKSTGGPAPRSLVARLEVPRLKLSALAREGVDVRTLRGSVGHVPGTALPGSNGNAAFAAHRDTFFRPLRDISRGDEVVVTTTSAVHRYSVTGTRVVDPADVSVLSPSTKPTLTLVTCYPFDYIGSAPKRFVVQAVELPRAARRTTAASGH